jgi:phosphotransferase system enzyme I (PtsI)
MSVQGTLLAGVGVGRGAVCGPVAKVRPAPVVPSDEPVPDDPAAAKEKVESAFATVAAGLRDQAGRSTGTVAEVLSATAQMADDRALRKQVAGKIDKGEAPLHALNAVVANFAAMFTAAGGYLAERVTDLHSVRDRVVANLLDMEPPGVPELAVPSVIVAKDLAPADTAALNLDLTLAIVTELGGPTSHTAIIAGQLGIPCVVRVAGAEDLAEGEEVAVDAAAGTVLVGPSEEVRRQFATRAAALEALAADVAPGGTADGHTIQLLANIGTLPDAQRAAETPAEGVGLFRTEVLYLERATAPTRAEQADVYAGVLRAMEGRKVVVRTIDAGADKPLAFVTQPDEENPALGVRAYRLVRTAPELLDTQLAALAEAQARTGIKPWVMAPMISTVTEAAEFAGMARAHGLETVGVMVEVPSAALRARDILGEVDFVSIGTNDLAQYTMATDRLRGELADLLDPFQPAVLDLVAATARAGTELGKPVGVCGESASDPVMALVLTGLGITSLSMSTGALPSVRFAIRQHTLEQCEAIAAAALAARGAIDGRAAAVELMTDAAREGLGL